MSGPVMDPTEINDIAIDVRSVLASGEQVEWIMSKAPLRSPADPTPLIARPMMKVMLDVDVAHTTLPTMKMAMKER